MSECTALSTVGFVPLTNGFTAIVDSNDLPLVVSTKWSAQPSPSTVYARNKRFGLMHRVLTQASTLTKIDHVNGFGFDNRRKNLRIATHQENMRNRRKNTAMTSRFKGVYCESTRSSFRPWRAAMSVNRKTIHLGRFFTEEDAARAYDSAAILHHGEFARLNFPNELQEVRRAK
jgi:hypothetical protein